EMPGDLLAVVQPQGLVTRLALLDSQGHVIVQSDGLSSSGPVDAIDQYLQAGTYLLTVNSTNTGGQGTYTLTTMLTRAGAPFQPIPVGVEPTAIVAGDFRGDGRLDLAVADEGLGTVSVLLGNGDGTFQPQVTTYAVGFGAHALVAGDFTGDGKLDLAVACGDG